MCRNFTNEVVEQRRRLKAIKKIVKMRYWRQFRDSLGETSVMITYLMIDYNDNKA
jgi:hypothetical protein